LSNLSIDLLIGTAGRTREVIRLFDSLASQSHRNFRAIVLDQNDDARLDPIVERYRTAFSIEHVQVPKGGRSRAMNQGLELVDADFIGFPDDDCWYPVALLQDVTNYFRTHPNVDGVCGRTLDERGRPTQLRWASQAGPVTRRNLFRRSIACTTFYRRHVVQIVGGFDESFGIRMTASGEIVGAGEESDYLLRAMAAGLRQSYDPDIVVHHDSYRPHLRDHPIMARSYSYGVDHSRLLRHHSYPTWFAYWRAVQLLAGSSLMLLRGQPGTARFYWAMAMGRLRGAVLPASVSGGDGIE
jgi:glycosyltransferase involved in cell wall biosynthesis